MCSRDEVDVFDFGRVEKKKEGTLGDAFLTISYHS